MKTIKALLLCATATLAATAFAGWNGWSYYNDSPESVDIGFGVDATVNQFHDPEEVGVNVFVSVQPYEEVSCTPLAIDEVNAQYGWLSIDFVVITNIQPYTL